MSEKYVSNVWSFPRNIIIFTPAHLVRANFDNILIQKAQTKYPNGRPVKKKQNILGVSSFLRDCPSPLCEARMEYENSQFGDLNPSHPTEIPVHSSDICFFFAAQSGPFNLIGYKARWVHSIQLGAHISMWPIKIKLKLAFSVISQSTFNQKKKHAEREITTVRTTDWLKKSRYYYATQPSCRAPYISKRTRAHTCDDANTPIYASSV